MEEAWVACELDRYCSHPLASSWMSYLQRWAAMPTLRRWWPALKSLFGKGFLDFADTQLHLSSVFAAGGTWLPAKIELLPVSDEARLAGFAWKRLQECRPGFPFHKRTLFALILTLPANAGSVPSCVQVGLAAVDVKDSVASWNIDDLFVPPELHGGGFVTSLLGDLIRHFEDISATGHVKRLEVSLEDSKYGTTAKATRLLRDQAGRQEQIELIDFYRSRDFKFDGSTWSNGQNTRMVRILTGTKAD
jgi:hypothetical protein